MIGINSLVDEENENGVFDIIGRLGNIFDTLKGSLEYIYDDHPEFDTNGDEKLSFFEYVNAYFRDIDWSPA